MATVEADRTVCIGAGQCVQVAKDAFDQDDDGIVEVLDGHPSGTLLDAVRRAVKACPASAITLHDA